MKYDPVKSKIGKLVNNRRWLRLLFYWLLDILLLRTWHVRKALHQFNNTNRDRGAILDAGSGFGQYSWRMWKINNNWKILGVDVKQEQIDDCNAFFSKTRAGKNVSFSFADLTEYSKAEAYDLILSVDVMEHIEDDNSVFRNFHTSLTNKGWLIISTPSDKGGSDVHHDHEHSFIDEHVRDGYGHDEIRNKLQSAGFNDIDIAYTYGKPGKISWRLSMKIPILMLNTTWLFALILPVWYILVMPLALILNAADVRRDHREGTGLLVIAKKEQN